MCLGGRGLTALPVIWPLLRHFHKRPWCTCPHSFCWRAEASERCVWSLWHLLRNFLPFPNTTEPLYASLRVWWKACLFRLLFYWSWCMTVIALSALCILITCFLPLFESLSDGITKGATSNNSNKEMSQLWCWWSGPFYQAGSKMKSTLRREATKTEFTFFAGLGVCIRRAHSTKAGRPQCGMHMRACGLVLMNASV